jgi:exopolysaccharide biosynthesis polyprenyl glycosylphosphotransferase
MRRLAPAMVVGVLPGMAAELPSGRDVRYVLLHAPQQVALQELDELLVDPAHTLSPEWAQLLMHAYAAGVPTCTVASLQEELSGRVSVESLHGARLGDVPLLSSYVGIKVLLDRVATLLALPLLLPLAAVVALAVLIDSGRPVLFFQERVGRNGRLFRMIKFRTMRADSEHAGAAFAAAGDARVTRVGHVLRRLRLDELPQFWNVLRGDMSIIGPRPEQRAFVETFNQEIRLYPVRHWVRPGITGWAQVVHGYAADTDTTIDKLRYDVFYIKYLSFWLDVRIVFKTLQTILTGFGAR